MSMSDHPKQPKLDRPMDGLRKIAQKRRREPSPKPSRSPTPAPASRHRSTPGVIAIHKGVDKGANSSTRGDITRTDKRDSGQFMPFGPTINLSVHGGAGGSGGWGSEHGGHGGTGEGPKITFPYSNVNLTNPDDKSKLVKEKLASHIAMLYKFTDQSKSLCASGTRVEIQADILKWLSPQTGTKEHIFWITGIAGSGKSTLSATLVDNLRKRGTPVAAQFFISRNVPGTFDPTKIIPTIAQQLAEYSPAATGIIYDKLKDGFPPSYKEQAEVLLLAPMRELCKSCDKVIIILIDALDELLNAAEAVKGILSPIASRGCSLPDNVRFLVTSRPEHWADISKSKTLEPAVFKHIVLKTESSVSEVRQFIVGRVKDITPDEPGWENWPHPEEVQKLSDKADGLFHYAATALHWIEDQIRNDGTACQDTVFAQFSLLGIGALEALYMVILTTFEDITRDLSEIQDKEARTLLELRRKNKLCGFQHVIGAILVLQKQLTISQIMVLLADTSDFDVLHFLRQMHSVLIPGTTTSFEEATPQMHKSFRDYIMEGHAPEEFRILTGHAHFITARSCLEVIVKGRAGSQSDIVVEYSVQHWYQHLEKAVEGGSTCEDERMWKLFGLMVEEEVVDTWKTNSSGAFVAVAAAGWKLLEVRAKCWRGSQVNNKLAAGY
ncbi:hypothetical protein MSAN_01104900 [Mycena sanguinolenta]|uniref:NACHT domain-containing protein n=1 Tax=Mycena sanguinolenta TaxID=230812 RepID=A0A8H7DA28_9AGAR|nr:hypothetical protein MSAN_01104900 [Mycena sanguinolenta]